MKKRDSFKGKLNQMPKVFPVWYLLFIIVLLLLWQAAGGQYAVRTIPYSDFKQALKNGQVVGRLLVPPHLGR